MMNELLKSRTYFPHHWCVSSWWITDGFDKVVHSRVDNLAKKGQQLLYEGVREGNMECSGVFVHSLIDEDQATNMLTVKKGTREPCV